MEKLKAEIIELKKQCEELEESKAEAKRELLELKDRFQIEISDVQADIIDEASSREGMNRRLSELRAEVNFANNKRVNFLDLQCVARYI